MKAIWDCEDIDTFEMERAHKSLAPGPKAEQSCWAVIIKLLRLEEKEINSEKGNTMLQRKRGYRKVRGSSYFIQLYPKRKGKRRKKVLNLSL